MNKFNIITVYISVQLTESCQHHVAQESVLVNAKIRPGKCDLKSSLCRGCSLWTWPNPKIFPFLPHSRDAVLYMYISVFNTSNTGISLGFLRTAFLTKFWKSPCEAQKSRIREREGQMNILRLNVLNLHQERTERHCCAIAGRRCLAGGCSVTSCHSPQRCRTVGSALGRWPSFLLIGRCFSAVSSSGERVQDLWRLKYTPGKH